ncbi:hypothetical protein D3C77_356550 [compost metagenome]
MHSRHAHPQGVAAWECAQAEKRCRDRDFRPGNELKQFFMATGINDPAAGENDRTLRFFDRSRYLLQLMMVRNDLWIVAAKINGLNRFEQGLVRGHVLRNVDQDRPFASRVGDMERFVNDARQLFYTAHQVAVLRNRHRDPGNIRFLEGIRSDQAGYDVSGNDHERNRVHKRRRDTGDCVRRPRSRGCDTYAYFAACPCIAVGRMNRSLLVSCQQVMEILKTIQRVVDIQYGPARVTEDAFDTF